jgi:hypothetical protein
MTAVASPPARTRAVARVALRLAPSGALAVVAVLVGGLLGALIGFLALMLLLDRFLDRLLDRAGLGRAEAEHAFLRLSRERRRATIAHRLRHQAGGDLAYLADDAGWAAVARRRPLGVVTIPVESVVGTADPHKAVAFDHRFRPPAYSRGRWTLMYRAVRRGATLPPVSVYRVGDEHVVRDGHHRVSVARALGVVAIDAEVVELDMQAVTCIM